MARNLTPKQNRFAAFYVELKGNGRQAYKAAGYSAKTDAVADVEASKLLRNPRVAALIEELTRAATTAHAVNAERVIAELAKIAFADLGKFVHVDANGHVSIDFQAASEAGDLCALSEVTQETYWDGKGGDAREVKRTKFKLHDKQRALELIGKNLSMWVERLKHEGSVEVDALPRLTPEAARDIDDEIERMLN